MRQRTVGVDDPEHNPDANYGAEKNSRGRFTHEQIVADIDKFDLVNDNMRNEQDS